MVELLQPNFGFLILEDTRAENYKGWSQEEIDILNKEDFISNAVKKLQEKKNLIATHAVGAMKCHIKKLNEVQFIKDEQRSSIILAEIIEEYKSGVCLFKIDDHTFKTRENFKNKSNETVKDYQEALHLFKQTNLSQDLGIVGVYGDNVKKLFRKSINECLVEECQGLVCFLFAHKICVEGLK